jgi:ABC-type oligopeptide transport system ATPase subunit
MSLLEVRNVTVRFRDATGSDLRAAVDRVCLSLDRGTSLGLVGESGSGKTTLGKAILKLQPVHEGEILFEGQSIAGLRGSALKGFRRRAQMIFQDPMGALDPRQTVGSALEEVLAVHRLIPRERRSARISELLGQVGLDSRQATRYPHEFSGGQRQRVGIARALALEPELLIADEPVSALDVSVQAQILNLLADLQTQLGFACLFIAHDLAVVRYLCPRVAVMCRGQIVESGETETVFSAPQHPYTAQLLAAVPDVQAALEERGNNATISFSDFSHAKPQSSPRS